MAAIPLDYVAYWKGSNVDGATLVDETQSYPGTISNSLEGDGRFGNVVEFDYGNAGNVNFGDILNIGLNSWTYSFWFKVNAIVGATGQAMITKAIAAATASYRLQISVDENGYPFAWLASSGAGLTAKSNETVTPGERYHCAVTINRSTNQMKIRINNKEKASTSISSLSGVNNQNDYPFRIGAFSGADYTTPLSTMDGHVEHVRIYQRVLTDEELKALYRESRPIPKDESFFFTMDQITESTLVDARFTHNGTIVNCSEVPGVDGNALSFNGLDSRVDIDGSAAFNVSEFTVSLFADTSSITAGAFVARDSGVALGTERQFCFGMEANGKFRASIFDAAGTEQQLDTVGTYNDGEPHGAELILTSSKIRIVVDGSLENEAALTITPNITLQATEGITLGARKGGGSFTSFYNGTLENVRFYPRAISLAEARVIYLTTSILKNLLSHWTMSAIENDQLLDETGNADATLYDHALVEGHIGKATYFNGTSAYADAGDVNDLRTEDLTIAGWINPSIYKSYNAWFVSKAIATVADYRYAFGLKGTSGHLRAFVNGNDGVDRIVEANEAVPLNTFSFVEFSWNRTSGILTIKMDNEVMATLDASPVAGLDFNSVFPFRLGAYTAANNVDIFNPFDGIADQFRIYNRLLTEDESDYLHTEQIEFYILQGTITENLAATGFHVRAYRLDNGALSGIDYTESGNYSIEITQENYGDHYVTAFPDQGVRWAPANETAINSLVMPNDLIATPYYFKATTSGTTGAVEPNWPASPGQTVNDNGVIFECVERINRPLTHGPVIPV